tara:strand:+ start:1344 stop:2561 length:1218 start_codon:yes stop_codon:yes gene_type:complete
MSNCRICRGKLIKIIDLGKIALVGNFYKVLKKKVKKYKISLNFCRKCKHVQIKEILNPNILFRNYLWETGVSKSNIFLIKNLLFKMKKFGLNKKSKVLEIASNDGSFLSILKDKFKCFTLGVDPAKNFKKKLEKNNIKTVFDFFNLKSSIKIKKRFNTFSFIFARNVVAHVPNPNEVFKGVFKLLDKYGIFILEVPHLMNILRYNQYDNIFHEHIGYHSLKSLIDLSTKNQLKVFDIEEIKSQGGSIRCYICKKENSVKVSRKIKLFLLKEKRQGLLSSSKLKSFKNNIINHKKKMQKLLNKLKKKNRKISIYGASGKGQALMQYCKISNDIIDNVFDKSKLKENCYTPGTLIKIRNPKMIKSNLINYLLILSWNIKDEIMRQEKNFKKNGGKFILPFPTPRIIN